MTLKPDESRSTLPPISNEDGPAKVLLSVLGGAFLTSALQALLTTPRYGGWIEWPLFTLGVLLICAGIFWRSINPRLGQRFSNSVRNTASDFRWWLGIGLCIWILAIVVPEIRTVNQIIALRNDVQSIARVIERNVLPRHLTKTQQRIISDFLLQFEPHEYAFKLISRNEEAGSYRADLQQALTKGGWTLSKSDPISYADDVQEGLQLDFLKAVEHSQNPTNKRDQNPLLILQQAFGMAGARVNGIGSGSNHHATQDSLIISIGRARKDSYELTQPDGF